MFEPQNADVMKRYAIVCGARDAKRGLRLRMITGFKCVKVKRYMIQVWQRCCRRGRPRDGGSGDLYVHLHEVCVVQVVTLVEVVV